MAKELKKKGRRLKKTVRKTLGTICLISAILIATIPVEGLKQVSADTATSSIGPNPLDEAAMEKYYNIPDLSEYEGKIYTTGDGTFQFAYVAPDKTGTDIGPTRVAVILGYNSVGSLAGGTLTIPDTVDAYLNYRTTDGTGQGYVAVGQSGNYLFYKVVEEVIPAVTDPSTGDVITPEEYIYAYNPCYYRDYDTWKDFGAEELYYYPTSNYKPDGTTEPIATDSSESYMRIKDATVSYIGNQYLKVSEAGDGGWEIAGDVDKEHGIFASKGSIVHLVVGENLSGIGNYAFYNCTAMQSIDLSNALNTIGNYAFAGCYNMSTVSMDLASDITAIGTHAFEDCQALKTITIPINVTTIGDAAFKGCWNLQSIDLCGQGQNVALRELGYEMFVNCRNLKSITFPQGFTADVDISNFEGCLSLQAITVRNTVMDITENFGSDSGTPVFGYDAFKQQYTESTAVHGTFYFEGPTNETNPSVLHQTAMDHYFAFSYLSDTDLSPLNIYELTVDAGSDKKATYRVNNQNQLVETELALGINTIDLPETIGPYYISTINSNVFKDNCSLEKLIVPATVQNIEGEAFIGCHHLKHVVFENPSALSIGEKAFQTQEVTRHQDSPYCVGSVDTEPKLTFTGPISLDSEPFRYAMDPANKINTGTQKLSYITYYSGWPQNLSVQYNPETDKNELVDYVTITDLRNYTDTFAAKESGEYVYPYMTDEYADAMEAVIGKKTRPADYVDPTLTEDEQELWSSVMDIVLPEGIEGVKEGLFKEKEVDSNEAGDAYFLTDDATYKTLTAYGLKEVNGDEDLDDNVDGGCFANWTTLSKVALYGDTTSIGDYAFKGCERLVDVTIPDTVTEIGLIPFTGCSELDYVNFQGSPYFTCDNSIIYQTDSTGSKYKIIEYLEGRDSGSITATEVEGVKEIAPEAFSGTNVSFADFSSSMIEQIPERAFAGCEKLIQVILPSSVSTVESQAFTECPNMQRITVPGIYTRFRVDAVDTEGENRPNDLVFVCNEDSVAYEYAKTYGFIVDTNGVNISYKVVFKDWDGKELKVEYVLQGQDATPPEAPTREGYDFVGWSEDYTGIKEDMTIYAMYETEDPNAKKVTVTFYDDDQTTVLATRQVTIGEVVELPPDPVKEGYVFIGWIGDVTAPITQPTNFYAKYEEKDGRFVVQFIDHDGTVLSKQMVEPGSAPIEPKSPEREGYTFAGWLPSDFSNITKDTDIYATYTKNDGSSDGSGDGSGGSGDGSGSGNGSGNTSNNSKLYTLTVQNGSGSGSYVAGSQPIIVANDPASGMEFSNWTIDPAGTKIASAVLTATVVTMPESDVTVTAHYKEKTGSSSGSGSAGNNGSSNAPNTNSGEVSNGTSVVIDKNGLSNTGVVSATVKGSSDNFVIKVTESTAAAEAALKALQAEYGNVDDIKYFPMDISLYDSTGTKLITDTTGLSISITLPLPDSLITYAGNNKVASVVNNRLDKLTPKFTTIDGVACVTFTAEHFSPYVIYVDTDNLTAGVVVDNTPKTGDGIHPKWFLSIGLACISVVLFMKKDKRTSPKVKAA